MTKKQVEKILRTVIDPELGYNLLDLGLIYTIKCKRTKAKGERVLILMTLTTPGCPLGGFFMDEVRKAVGAGLGIGEDDVDVQITFDPPWTTEMIKEDIRVEMGF